MARAYDIPVTEAEAPALSELSFCHEDQHGISEFITDYFGSHDPEDTDGKTIIMIIILHTMIIIHVRENIFTTQQTA